MAYKGMTKEQLIKELGRLRSRLDELERNAAAHRALRKTLEQSQQQLRLILDSTREGVFGLDLDGNHTFVNPAAAKMLGYEAEELLGRPSHSTWHHSKPDGSSYPEEECPIYEILRKGTVHHVRYEVFWHKDGASFSVAYSGAPLKENDRIVGAVVTFWDISEIKLYENALRQERDTAQTYLDIAGVMLVVIDADQRVKLINKKGCEILGYAAAEIIGQNWFDQFLPERVRDQTRGLFTQLLAGKLEEWEYTENPVLTKNGAERLIAWHNTVWRDASGRIIATLSSGEDITEKKQAEAGLLNRKRELQTLHEISGIFLKHHPLKETLQVIVEEVGEVTGFPLVAIEFYQQERQTMIFEAVRGIPRPAGPEPIEVPVDETPSGIVARTGQPLVETQTRDRLEYAHTSLRQLGVQTFVCLPLIDRQKVIGVLSLGHPEELTVEDSFLQWAMSIANYLAALIVHRRQEEELARSSRFISDIISHAREGIIVYDRQLNYLIWNRFMEELTDLPAEEVLGKNALRLFPHLKKHGVDLLLKRALKGESVRSGDVHFYIPQTNREGWVSSSYGPNYDAAGNIVGVIGIVNDITARKQAEQEIQRLASFPQLNPNPVLEVDFSGRITFANQAARATVKRLVPPARLTDLLPQDLREILASARKKPPKQFYREVKVRNAVFATSIYCPESLQVVRFYLTDITARHRSEEELRQAQKMEAIGTLAGGIAHDFNNILSAIFGFGEVIEVFHSPQDPILRANLEEILKAASRAKELVQQILTFSRKGEQDRRIMQLKPIVKESLRFLRASLPTTIEIRQSLEPEVGAIWADPTQMQQVVMNLCTNAAHAMGEKGGVLEVGLAELEVEPESLESGLGLTLGPHVRLTVKDTGHAMTPEILERIFDPYFTTKGPGEGTGLGLAVVDGIVKSHNGAIAVTSEPGMGTTFSVFFTRYQEREMPRAADTRSPITGGKGRILFVDDEPAIANFVKEALTILGYEVEASTGSKAALEIFLDRPEQFDLVITDLTMPQMSGLELAQELRRLRPDLPVILCTGLGDPFNQDHLNSLGFRELLRKPLGVRNLAEVIKKVLN